jgi:hypothetical protein
MQRSVQWNLQIAGLKVKRLDRLTAAHCHLPMCCVEACELGLAYKQGASISQPALESSTAKRAIMHKTRYE